MPITRALLKYDQSNFTLLILEYVEPEFLTAPLAARAPLVARSERKLIILVLRKLRYIAKILYLYVKFIIRRSLSTLVVRSLVSIIIVRRLLFIIII